MPSKSMNGKMAPVIKALVVISLVLGLSRADPSDKDDPTCRGGQVVLSVSTAATEENTTFYGFPADFGPSLSSKIQPPLQLVPADPINACKPLLHVPKYEGTAVLVSRGDCSFAVKAIHLQAANASLAIIYNNESGCFGMTAEAANETTRILIPSLSVSRTTGRALVQAAAARATVSAYMLPQRLDPGDVIMWLLAVTILWGAAVWAGSDYLQETQASSRRGSGESAGAREGAGRKEASADVFVITTTSAVSFVVFASAWLLLIFLFTSVFRIVMAAMFGIGATMSMMELMLPVLLWAVPSLRARKLQLSPSLQPDLATALALPCCLSLAVAWAFLADRPGGWLLNDLLGASVLLLALRHMRLTSIKVATILLLLTFAYDIFWVILQPLILGGPSVMIEVATGGDSRIPIPFLLMMPHFFNSQMSILGFGDIVLPGLLVVYTRIFDLKHERKGWASYFYPTLLAYSVGLVLTYIALILQIGGQQGQPALMWLVPCTLGTVVLLGWRRGDLYGMWRGFCEEDLGSEGKGEPRLPSIQEDVLERGEASDSSSSSRSDLSRSLLNRGSAGSM